MIDGLFSELAVWADKPRWAGSGFTRLVIELADLPGHPARLIARRHKSMLEAQFADRLAKAGVGLAPELAREIWLLRAGRPRLRRRRGAGRQEAPAWQNLPGACPARAGRSRTGA
jgi:hypothetical protein